MEDIEFYKKVVIPIVAALFGWGLAQVSSYFKEYFYRRKICRLLEDELLQLKVELERLLIKISRHIQIAANQGIESSVNLPVEAHIYQNYYKDAVIALSMEQRISFQMIHTSLKSINESSKTQLEILGKVDAVDEGDEEAFLRVQARWRESVVAEYMNTAAALWHIKYHLDNKSNPKLGAGDETHRSYLKWCQQARDEVSKIQEGAKDMKLEDFDKIYDEAGFAKVFKGL